ncbi:MAG: PEP-CTERM sorting domain-containing protein [Phycisphaerae bacterium]
MYRISLTVALACIIGLAASAGAAPTIDGTVVGDEYDAVLTDTTESGPLYEGGLDIDQVFFAADDDYLYVGLSVKEPALDRNGEDTSVSESTVFVLNLSDEESDTPLGQMQVIMYDSAAMGVFFQPGSLFTPDWSTQEGDDLKIADALEVRIPKTELGEFGDTLSVFGQLDGTGFGHDDQVTGTVTIPEPTTMALLATVGAGMLLRRRRR